MKHLLITIIAVAILAGCSDPEAEANRLFVEASQAFKDDLVIVENQRNIVRAGDDISTISECFKRYKNIIENVDLIQRIPTLYPTTQLSVKITEGNLMVNGMNLKQIKKMFQPRGSIFEVFSNGNVDSMIKYLALGTDINSRVVRTNRMSDVRVYNYAANRHWQVPSYDPKVDKMFGVGDKPIVISWKWDEDQPRRELMAERGVWEDGAWTFFNVKDYWPKVGFPEANPIKSHEKLRIEEINDNPFLFAPVTPFDHLGGVILEHSDFLDFLRKHGAKTGAELKAEGK